MSPVSAPGRPLTRLRGPRASVVAFSLAAVMLAGCIQPNGMSPTPGMETLYQVKGKASCTNSQVLSLSDPDFSVFDHDELVVRIDLSADAGSAVLEIRDPNNILVFERTATAGAAVEGSESVRTTSKGEWDVKLRCSAPQDGSTVTWDIVIEGKEIERPEPTDGAQEGGRF